MNYNCWSGEACESSRQKMSSVANSLAFWKNCLIGVQFSEKLTKWTWSSKKNNLALFYPKKKKKQKCSQWPMLSVRRGKKKNLIKIPYSLNTNYARSNFSIVSKICKLNSHKIRTWYDKLMLEIGRKR